MDGVTRRLVHTNKPDPKDDKHMLLEFHKNDKALMAQLCHHFTLTHTSTKLCNKYFVFEAPSEKLCNSKFDLPDDLKFELLTQLNCMFHQSHKTVKQMVLLIECTRKNITRVCGQ